MGGVDGGVALPRWRRTRGAVGLAEGLKYARRLVHCKSRHSASSPERTAVTAGGHRRHMQSRWPLCRSPQEQQVGGGCRP
jgi:hypothetical protein